MKKIRTWMPRLITGLGSLVLMLGILTAFQGSGLIFSSPAHALTTEQFCYYNGRYACLNANGGGPWVDTYTGGPYGPNLNLDFAISSNSGGTQIEFIGGGAWAGKCIGDAYNSSSYADASLDSCGNNGEGAGWGTNFKVGTSGCPAGEEWFHDAHWDGYLGPPNGWSNGSHFYLNNKAYYCFAYSSP